MTNKQAIDRPVRGRGGGGTPVVVGKDTTPLPANITKSGCSHIVMMKVARVSDDTVGWLCSVCNGFTTDSDSIKNYELMLLDRSKLSKSYISSSIDRAILEHRFNSAKTFRFM